MTQHARTKVTFVLPFDFRHREQTIDQVRPTALARITSGRFVLDNVSTFKPARTVHRRKPTGNVTQQTKRSANHCGAQFAPFVWSSAETLQHLTNQFAMMPLFVFDLFNLRSIVGVAQ